MRQAVDQVEVDAVDAGAPQTSGRSRGCLKALYPIDGALYRRIEALHAEARPIDTAKGKRLDHLGRERARIDLDRDLGRRLDEERMPNRSGQVGKRIGRHDGRRSAAEMNVIDLQTTTDLPRDQVDLTAQRRRIDRDRVVTTNNRGVAAAIPAHRPAERDMQIKRHTGI